MNTTNNSSIQLSNFTLMLIISLAPVTAVLFSSGIPEIKQQFNISSANVQWTVSIFLLGYACVQPFVGPIANRLMRKRTLYLTLILSSIAAFICAIAGPVDSYSTLIAARFLLGLVTGTGLAITFIIINDVYAEQQAREKITYAFLGTSLLQGLSVTVGGFIVKHFDWESTFYFLILYYIFLIIFFSYRLPETRPPIEKKDLSFKNILSHYKMTAKDLIYWCYTLMYGLNLMAVYIFYALAPLIGISIMGASPAKYGLFSILLTISFFLGDLLSLRLVKIYSSYAVITIGIVILILGCLAFLYTDSVHAPNLWFLFIPASIIFFGVPMGLTNTTALATRRVKDKAIGSSLMTTIGVTLAVSGFFITGLLRQNPEEALSIIFIIIVLLMIGLFLAARWMSKRDVTYS